MNEVRMQYAASSPATTRSGPTRSPRPSIRRAPSHVSARSTRSWRPALRSS